MQTSAQVTQQGSASCISFASRALLGNWRLVMKGCVLSTFVCLKKGIETIGFFFFF